MKNKFLKDYGEEYLYDVKDLLICKIKKANEKIPDERAMSPSIYRICLKVSDKYVDVIDGKEFFGRENFDKVWIDEEFVFSTRKLPAHITYNIKYLTIKEIKQLVIALNLNHQKVNKPTQKIYYFDDDGTTNFDTMD